MQDNLAVQLGLPIAIMVIMCGIGLTLTLADFQRISQKPKPVLVGLLGHYLLLPLLGFAVAWAFALPTDLAVGLVLVAACPSGSSSNALTYLARGNVALAVTLTVISALATFISVPLLVNLALDVFGGEAREIRLPLGPTIKHLTVLVLGPVMFGMAVRRFAPTFARKVEPAIGKFSLALLLAVIMVLVYTERATLGGMLVKVGPAALTMGCAAVGLVLVAACPSGSSSNALTYLARGNVALAVTLTVISALATFISVPLLVNLALDVFGGEAREIRLPLGPTIKHLTVLVLGPVMLGMAVRRFAPTFARKVEPAIGKFSLALLLAVIMVLVYTERATLGGLLVKVGPAALTLGCAAIGLGYLLGRACGLVLRDAITVGMEVGVQNATLAIVIALTLLNSPQIALPGAIYGLLMYLPALALVVLGRRAVAREEAGGATAP